MFPHSHICRLRLSRSCRVSPPCCDPVCLFNLVFAHFALRTYYISIIFRRRSALGVRRNKIAYRMPQRRRRFECRRRDERCSTSALAVLFPSPWVDFSVRLPVERERLSRESELRELQFAITVRHSTPCAALLTLNLNTKHSFHLNHSHQLFAVQFGRRLLLLRCSCSLLRRAILIKRVPLMLLASRYIVL